MEKKYKYAQLMTKLKKATYNEYYYEAIFIEYAILEERTRSMLEHAKVFKDIDKCTLNVKLNKLKSNKIFQDKYIQKHLTKELLDEIYDWKNQRNKLMHDIIKTDYDNEKVKTLALNGECLAKKLNNKSNLINNYFDKKYEK